MNKRIYELAKQAWTMVSDEERARNELYEADTQRERRDQVFAELIVAECNKISKETCNELKADESIQTPGSKINWNLYNATLRNKLAEHFWVEL